MESCNKTLTSGIKALQFRDTHEHSQNEASCFDFGSPSWIVCEDTYLINDESEHRTRNSPKLQTSKRIGETGGGNDFKTNAKAWGSDAIQTQTQTY